MGFAFEYVGLTARDAGCGTWVAAGDQQLALLGWLSAGRIELGEPVLLPTASGVPFRGYVARFAESFSDWLGLPFYDWLTPDTMPGAFCLCVGGPPGEPGFVCPGVAMSESEVAGSQTPKQSSELKPRTSPGIPLPASCPNTASIGQLASWGLTDVVGPLRSGAKPPRVNHPGRSMLDQPAELA